MEPGNHVHPRSDPDTNNIQGYLWGPPRREGLEDARRGLVFMSQNRG